jgi:thiamine-phosphate pyrophosphorylase
MILLPRLYAIVDSSAHASTQDLVAYVAELAAGGCRLLQYRNKSGNAQVMIEHARELRSLCRTEPALSLPTGVSDPQVRLIMNDRADLCLAAEFHGVHVGQEDLSPESVRGIIGVESWLGVSTHNAIGPVFATSSKDKADPVVGLEGVRLARALTRKPLVAIGGITRANAASVIEAGADSVAVISDLLREPRKSAEEFFRVLR